MRGAGVVAMVVVTTIAAVPIIAAAIAAMRRSRGLRLGETSPALEGGAARPGDGVYRVLLVADGACTRSELEDLAVGAGEVETVVFVVAPAEAHAHAQDHLDRTIRALADLGLRASGRVGSPDPLQATDDALREFPADEIVFVSNGAREDGAGALRRHGAGERPPG